MLQMVPVQNVSPYALDTAVIYSTCGYVWHDVRKIIDKLHIRNHKDEKCKIKYGPDGLKEEEPEYNTMCCEQTFVWLSRFKKVLCAMTKEHFHFYLHRLTKRRNN